MTARARCAAIACAALAGWAVATGCQSDPQPSTLAYTWQAAGTTVSVAAWSPDSAALRRAIEQVQDTMQRLDSASSRDALRRAWAVEREDLRVQPEWSDVADSHVLDRAVAVLAAVADSALIDLGGVFLWIGPPTSRAVGVADPDNALKVLAHVELQTGSLSTVVGEHRSVTALAPDAFRASSWASALFSLGCDRALALAPRLEGRGIGVVCVDSAGVRWTTNLQNRVLLRPARAP